MFQPSRLCTVDEEATGVDRNDSNRPLILIRSKFLREFRFSIVVLKYLNLSHFLRLLAVNLFRTSLLIHLKPNAIKLHAEWGKFEYTRSAPSHEPGTL
jgi:hypothetical protein